MPYYIAFAVILGLVIGSFLNVCIYRIPAGISIVRPPSFCPKCGHRLGFLDLFPILSALFLRFKCRYCDADISKRYALVEALTGAVFGMLMYRFGFGVEFFAYSFLMSVLIIVFFIDLKLHIIPMSVIWAGITGGACLIVYNLFAPVELYRGREWFSPILGMIVCPALLYLISVIGSFAYKTSEAMGLGDVYLYIPIGMFLGWKMSLLSLFFAVVIGAAAGILLMALNVKKRGDEMPFGPAIAAGVFFTVMWGNQLLNWYLSLLNI